MSLHSSTTTSSSLDTAQLRVFFDRLAAGDYRNLANELQISGKPIQLPTAVLDDSVRAAEAVANPDADRSGDSQDPDASIQTIDSVDSFKFQPTTEGIHRAVSLIRESGGGEGAAKPEGEDEAFEFTFRVMIHKLYSMKDFAKMVDDVVRSSRDTYRPLPPQLRPRGRGRRQCSPGPGADADGYRYKDGDSFADLRTPTTSEMSSELPSSDSSWMLDRGMAGVPFEDESEARAVKKRIVGRTQLSVVDGSFDVDEENAGRAWTYRSAVASVESPTAYVEDEAFSPALCGHAGASDETPAEYGVGSRKRRYSFLAARGL